MLGSRYFAARYFAARSFHGVTSIDVGTIRIGNGILYWAYVSSGSLALAGIRDDRLGS